MCPKINCVNYSSVELLCMTGFEKAGCIKQQDTLFTIILALELFKLSLLYLLTEACWTSQPVNEFGHTFSSVAWYVELKMALVNAK